MRIYDVCFCALCSLLLVRSYCMTVGGFSTCFLTPANYYYGFIRMVTIFELKEFVIYILYVQ